MQKIRDKFHRPLSLTRLVVGFGISLFLAGVFLLQESGTAANISAARASFVWAGWVLTAGWVLKRIDDRQWPFSSRSGGRRPIPRSLRIPAACVFALVLGATVWRLYGPLMQAPIPVRTVSLRQDDPPVLFRPRSLLPTPSTYLSLTDAAQPWTFDPLAVVSSRYRPESVRFGFSSQAMVSPPALSGNLPSSWDIQP